MYSNGYCTSSHSFTSALFSFSFFMWLGLLVRLRCRGYAICVAIGNRYPMIRYSLQFDYLCVSVVVSVCFYKEASLMRGDSHTYPWMYR